MMAPEYIKNPKMYDLYNLPVTYATVDCGMLLKMAWLRLKQDVWAIEGSINHLVKLKDLASDKPLLIRCF